MGNSERDIRDQFKQEYLEGLRAAETLHKECSNKVLEKVKDKLTDIIDDADTLEEAQDKIELIIQMIDEYIDGDVTADELSAEDRLERDIQKLDRITDALEDDEDIISLTDFVRKDF